MLFTGRVTGKNESPKKWEVGGEDEVRDRVCDDDSDVVI